MTRKMNWTLFIWLIWALNNLCKGQHTEKEDYKLSEFGYHLCTRNETRLVSYTVEYMEPYTVTKQCGSWIPWKTCKVTEYQKIQYTEYKTVTEQVTRCCDGYVQVGHYCALMLNRSRELIVKPGFCPTTTVPPVIDCERDTDCPGWQKCCQFCTDPTSSDDFKQGGSQFNATVTIKVDYNDLMSREGGLYNHTRLLYAMVNGVLKSNASIYYLSSQPVHPYRTATSLMIDCRSSPSLYNVTIKLHQLIKHIQEVSSATVQDIDECAQPFLHGCSPHADCVNTVGSYYCTCHPGYADVDHTNPGTNCTAMSTSTLKTTSFPPVSTASTFSRTTTQPLTTTILNNTTYTSETQPPTTCAPSISSLRVANVTATSFCVHWSSQFPGNQSYSVVLRKGSKVIYFNDTSQTKLTMTGLEAGALYDVTVTPQACGRHGNSVQLTVKTDAQTLNATARLTNVEYTSDFENTSSSAYTNLSADIYMEIYRSLPAEMKALVDSGQVRIEITGFTRGSVIVTFTLVFTLTQSEDISNVTSAVLTSLMDSSKYEVDSNNTKIMDRDECALKENDCSLFATCNNTWGSYTCTCWKGFVDVNPERPGRSCEAAPLVNATVAPTTISVAPTITTPQVTITSAPTNPTAAITTIHTSMTSITAPITNTTVAPTTTPAKTPPTPAPAMSTTASTTTTVPATTNAGLTSNTATTTTTTKAQITITAPTTVNASMTTTSAALTTTTTTTKAPTTINASMTTTSAAPTTTTTTTKAPTTINASMATTSAALTTTTTTTKGPTTINASMTTTSAALTTTTTTTKAPTTINASMTTTSVAPTTITTTTKAPTTINASMTTISAAPTTTTTTTKAPTTINASMTTISVAPTTTTVARTTNTTSLPTSAAMSGSVLTTLVSTTSPPNTISLTSTTNRPTSASSTTNTTIPTTSSPQRSGIITFNISASEAITVMCNMASITVTVAKDFLQSSQIAEAALYLGMTNCGVSGGNSTHVQLTVAWDECNTILTHNDSYYSASVTLFNTINTNEGSKIRLQIPVICSYMKDMLVTSDFGSVGYDMIKDVILGSGMFQVTLQLMNGSVPLPHNYSLSPSEAVVLVVSLNTSVDKIKVVIKKCWVTPTSIPTLVSSYIFMDNRCSINPYTTVITNGNSSTSSLSVQIFSFVDLSIIYLHCQVEICVEIGLDSCAPDCYQRTSRSGNTVGTVLGTSGPLLRLTEETFEQEFDKVSIIGLSCLGVGLAIFFIIGFVCLFYYQRNRIGTYNFTNKPREENNSFTAIS